jgi:hypothetical protein
MADQERLLRTAFVAGALTDAVGVRVFVGVIVAVGETVEMMVGVGGATLQPLRALRTAARISSTVMYPSWVASPASHAATGALPSAMFTMVSGSLTVTCPS